MTLNRDGARSRSPINDCAREPIHVPGSIQAHGYLLAVTEPALTIEHASDNCGALWQTATDSLLGQRLERLLTAPAYQRLRTALEATVLQAVNPLRLECAIGEAELTLEASVHRCDGLLIVELEPLRDAAAPSFSSVYQRIRLAVDAMSGATSLSELYRVTAEQAKALSGYQRVMIYRFDAQWNGQVLAEAREPDQDPYLGLHYPASDIPAQARQLYRVNWIRVIPDVAYTPIPIIAARSARDPLDLSHSALRSVSPVHIQYLKNMGVGASASVSLFKNGELWGLIALHHQRPAYLSYEMRQGLEFIGRLFSAQLAAQEKYENVAYKARLESTHQQLLSQMRQASAFMDGLRRGGACFLDLAAGSSGGAIVYRDQVTLVGTAPAEDAVRQIADWLRNTMPTTALFHTTHLLDHFPHAATFSEVASGMLAISIPEVEPSYVFWFKPEVVQTVNWGGDPRKPVEVRDGGARLSPRRSFALWQETVRHTALPWEREEIEAIEALRRSIIEVDLERQVRAAMASNAELDQFASVIAHDLKEPLRGISFFARFLEEDLHGQISPEIHEHLLEIKQLSGKASALIGELYEYSKLGRLELAFGQVDLEEVVRDAASRLSALFNERNVELRIETPLPTAFCDRIRMVELYANLLANAARYNDQSSPRISVGADCSGTAPIFFVSDNGIGIPPAASERVFKMFQRLHEPGQYGGGTGVGLAIVKRVVDQHGGRIWIESTPGQGTTFRFTLQPEPLPQAGVPH